MSFLDRENGLFQEEQYIPEDTKEALTLHKIIFSRKPKTDSYNEDDVMVIMYFDKDIHKNRIHCSMSANEVYHFPHKYPMVEVVYA